MPEAASAPKIPPREADVRANGKSLSAPRTRLDGLTSLRFFAAFHVVLFHVHPALPWLAPNHPLKVLWAQFCGHGFTAVSFFFTLSGFILAYNYPPTRQVENRVFFRARFARIYPVYALGLVLGLPFLAMRVLKQGQPALALAELVLAVTLLQAWVPWLWFAVNAPGWSLSVEAFFYAVFPWLMRRVERFSSGERRAFLALLVLYALALSPALLGTLLSDTGLPIQDETPAANFVRYTPVFALPSFTAGIVLGRIHAAGFWPALGASWLWWTALALLFLALSTPAIPYMLLHNGALMPLFSVLILGCAAGAAPRWLAHPWLVLLGEASYALYVTHLLVWVYVKIPLERAGVDLKQPWVFPLYAALALGVSVATYRWLETPARKRLLVR